jgi:molybdopterin-containing oxidoreductase family iron-sulfur binding subunit
MSSGAQQALGGRRKFLGLAAAGMGGVLLAPGIHLIEVAQAATPGASAKVRWGLLIDLSKCESGCTECVSACNTENGLDPRPSPTSAQWIRKVEIKEIKTGRTASLPVMCQHCAEPPCVDVCPTGASFKRADGIVLVDRHSCIGCRYCVMACPYKARSFVHEPVTDQKPDVPRGKGCVEGCTLCVHRVDKGGTPACVEACAKAGHHAMLFGDLNDPQSEIARRVRAVASTQLRADLRLDPGVRYQGL